MHLYSLQIKWDYNKNVFGLSFPKGREVDKALGSSDALE
jgi:hypothetical protein